MIIVETEAYAQEGVGKPDYSEEVFSGQIRPGLSLKYRQSLYIASIACAPIISGYSWIQPVLAPGDIAHLIDWETGLPMPYTCVAGYIYSVVTIAHSGNQDHVVRIYFSTPALGIPLMFAGQAGTTGSGESYHTADIVPYSTEPFDPTALYAHGVDFTLENLGGGNFEGACTMTAIREAVGTPPIPPDKTVKCKFCGHEWVVPRETTFIKCPDCGEFNIYCDFSSDKVRGIRR